MDSYQATVEKSGDHGCLAVDEVSNFENYSFARAVVNRCVKGTRRRPLLPFRYRTSFHERLYLPNVVH